MPAIPPGSAISTRIMNHQQEVYNTQPVDHPTAAGPLPLNGMEGDYGIENATLNHNYRVANALEKQCQHHRQNSGNQGQTNASFGAHALGAKDIARQRTNDHLGDENAPPHVSSVPLQQQDTHLDHPQLPKSSNFAQSVADSLKYTTTTATGPMHM